MEDPYASPQTVETAAAPEPDSPEAIRKKHLNHEASVKSIGLLYMLGGILLLLSTAGTLAPLVVNGSATWQQIALPAGIAVLSLGYLVCGFGIRGLKPWTKIPVSFLAAIGLLGFPIGTLISAYILYLILSKKGAMVLSPAYKEIIRATPHIRYRTSIWIWILLALFIALLIFIFFMTRG